MTNRQWCKQMGFDINDLVITPIIGYDIDGVNGFLYEIEYITADQRGVLHDTIIGKADLFPSDGVADTHKAVLDTWLAADDPCQWGHLDPPVFEF